MRFGQISDDTVSTEDFEVQTLECPNGWLHLKIKRFDSKDGITWDELQAIKDERFPNHTAVEIYPPHDEIVNEANIRHLWIVPNGLTLPSLYRKYE